MTAPTEARRCAGLDLLRILAAAAVVWLHTADLPLQPWLTRPGTAGFWLAHATLAARWCVPLFVLLSGALLLDPSRLEAPAVFYRKRARRILTPLAAWLLIYTLNALLFARRPVAPGYWQAQLIRGEAYFHLWYLFMAVGLYAFTPYLRTFLRAASAGDKRALLGVLAAYAGLHWIFGALVGRRFYLVAQDALLFAPFLFYYVAGHLLAATPAIRAGAVWRPLALALVGWLAGVAGEAALWSIRGKAVGLFYSHFSPSLMLMAAGLFVAGLRLGDGRNWPPRIRAGCARLADASFGLYCAHFLVIKHLYRLHLPLADWPLPCHLAAKAAVILIVSYALIALLRRLPLLKAIV